MQHKKISPSHTDDRSSAGLEAPESLFSLHLRPVTVNTGDWESLVVEVGVQRVCALLRLHEHQGS